VTVKYLVMLVLMFLTNRLAVVATQARHGDEAMVWYSLCAFIGVVLTITALIAFGDWLGRLGKEDRWPK
jgi:hypothetical protein